MPRRFSMARQATDSLTAAKAKLEKIAGLTAAEARQQLVEKELEEAQRQAAAYDWEHQKGRYLDVIDRLTAR